MCADMCRYVGDSGTPGGECLKRRDLTDWLGDFIQQVSHGHLVSLHRGHRNVGIALWVDELPVQAVARVGGQLGKEGALGAPVAVAKRV